MSRPLFSAGFRPLFLGAAWYAALAVAMWTVFLTTGRAGPGALHPLLWHGHEMLFGFAGAVIAGFLLTAVGNWTGRPAATPGMLAGLTMLWLSARIGFLFPDLVPLSLTSVLDLAFLPVLTIMMARVLVASRNRRNYAFVPILLALTGLNAAIHLELHRFAPGLGFVAMQLSVWLISVLLVFMGGRVIPFFTERRLPTAGPRQWRWLNWTSTLATLAVIPAYLLLGRGTALAYLLLAAGVLTLARGLAWRPWRSRGVPLLWILHLGYLWIPVGLALQGAHLLGAPVGWSAGVHALTVGALGSLTLGMMARVALGHSGRELVASGPVVAAFVLVSLAALTRLAMTLPGAADWLLVASALCWGMAFGLYGACYTPILFAPRRTADA